MTSFFIDEKHEPPTKSWQNTGLDITQHQLFVLAIVLQLFGRRNYSQQKFLS
jgi:hypothetical protein